MQFKENLIPSCIYEIALVNVLRNYLKIFEKLKIQPPVFITLTLTKIKGYFMSLNPCDYRSEQRNSIDQDVLIIPECEITDFSMKAEEILKPSFNLIWNACGWKESLNYHHETGWIHTQATS